MIINETNLNRNWTTYKLAELGEFSRGKSKHRPRDDKRLFENGKYPLIQTGDISNSNLYVKKHSQMYSDFGLSQSKLWPKGTLCITIAANIAEVAILAYPMCFPDSIVGFNADSTKTSNEFMYYVFKFIQQHIQKMASGSIQDNINIDYLLSLEFKIPTLKEQEAILHSLLTFDNKIENNTLVNDNLMELAKTLYQSWFVNYEPFGGIKPTDWIDGTINDLGNEIICGKTPPTQKAEYYGGNTPFITIPDMHDCVYNVSTERYLSAAGVASQSKKSLPTNTVCVSCIGTAGLVTIVSEESQTNQQINSIVPKDGISPYYTYLLMKTLSETINTLGQSGSTIVNLNKTEFGKIQVTIPSKHIMQKFNYLCGPLFEKIHSAQKENKKLASLRDWLLPMLMTGQVTISD